MIGKVVLIRELGILQKGGVMSWVKGTRKDLKRG